MTTTIFNNPVKSVFILSKITVKLVLKFINFLISNILMFAIIIGLICGFLFLEGPHSAVNI